MPQRLGTACASLGPGVTAEGLELLRVPVAMMKSEVVSIDTPDGSFNATLVGQSDKSLPALVMIPEIFGINSSLLDMAENFARQGFVVLALDIFWRLQPNVNLGYVPDDFKFARELHGKFDYALGIRDMQAGIDYLRRHPASTKKVGVVGYCLGGTLAYLAASRTNADAAAGYYGTRIDSYLDDGPKISRPLILHLGRLDHRTPPPIMSAILAAVADNKNVEPFIYEDAHHGFANHTRLDVFHPEAARTANERTIQFFRKNLS